MTWTKIGSKERRRITADWASQFPEFTAARSMWLLRRWGPIVCGVLLEAHEDSYVPGFHLHNLLRPFPTLSLSCHTDLKGHYVHFEWHERAYQKHALALRDMMQPFLCSTLTMDSLREYCRSWLKSRGQEFHIGLAEDLALTSRWMRRGDFADDHEYARDYFGRLPSIVQSQLGGPSAWKARFDALLSDPTLLGQTLDAELKKHKLERLEAGTLI